MGTKQKQTLSSHDCPLSLLALFCAHYYRMPLTTVLTRQNKASSAVRAKVAGDKVYPRPNQNNRAHAVTASIGHHRPVMSWGNACCTCMHKPVRCMHWPVMSQGDACSYCMGSVVLISSQIYLYSSYFECVPLISISF
jgi:hypothetical protein